ncbi:SDR family NAD(P)-dependent oxidoreductase [Kitasatospora sp. NPDC057936]|uniref:SDR family NAD(P)-dependent oxidoreductase n=1 Tax=Kitasatospora sp. NPDC057936 TaxID=3346283 RepID=UPI0036D9BB4D
MSIDLTGKRILVTGGSRGIGRGIVLALARAGARTVACYRTESPAVESLRGELAATGGEHHLVQADVSVPEDVERLVSTAKERFGALDVVVNNAGVISHVPFPELPLEEWRRVLDTNLTAPFLVIQKSLPLLSPGSSVITVGSRAAVIGIPLRAHYTASKAGLIGLTRSLMKELGPKGIRVNLVAPGVIETEEFETAPPEEVARVKSRYQGLTGLGRLGTPDEIAGAVLFLSSDLSAYVTGETIHVDGGI